MASRDGHELQNALNFYSNWAGSWFVLTQFVWTPSLQTTHKPVCFARKFIRFVERVRGSLLPGGQQMHELLHIIDLFVKNPTLQTSMNFHFFWFVPTPNGKESWNKLVSPLPLPNMICGAGPFNTHPGSRCRVSGTRFTVFLQAQDGLIYVIKLVSVPIGLAGLQEWG